MQTRMIQTLNARVDDDDNDNKYDKGSRPQTMPTKGAFYVDE